MTAARHVHVSVGIHAASDGGVSTMVTVIPFSG